jgi:hypothetical protein
LKSKRNKILPKRNEESPAIAGAFLHFSDTILFLSSVEILPCKSGQEEQKAPQQRGFIYLKLGRGQR